MSLNEITDLLKSSTVFRDETKLSIDYTPFELPHRKEMNRKLFPLFREMLFNPGGSSPKVWFTGPPGTGKTATAKRFGWIMECLSRERGIKLKYVHINCRQCNTPYLVLTRLLKNLTSAFPKRGFKTEELCDIFLREILEKEDRYILLCLDEADLLFYSDSSIIYNLMRLGDAALNAKQRLSFITITRNGEFGRYLDASSRSTFLCTQIVFEKYSAPQLESILRARILEAFYDGTVLSEAVRLIADLTAEMGDVRQALNLLWLAGKIADELHNIQITAEHVRLASESMKPFDLLLSFPDLSLHHYFYLLAILRHLRKTEAAYVTVKAFYDSYVEVCKGYGFQAHAKLVVPPMLNILEVLGFITIKKEFYLGDSEMRLNVPTTKLEPYLQKQIEEQIADKAKERLAKASKAERYAKKGEDEFRSWIQQKK